MLLRALGRWMLAVVSGAGLAALAAAAQATPVEPGDLHLLFLPLARAFARLEGFMGPYLEGYGLTEACPVLTFNRADRFRFGSVGLPLTGVELKLAADGEILARGPNVATRGYWRKPAATAEAFETGGWLRTGDVGRIDTMGTGAERVGPIRRCDLGCGPR